MTSIRRAFGLALLALAASACGPSIAHSTVDLVMTSAYRPRPEAFALPA